MATLSAYRNGLTMGTPGGNPAPPKRGRIVGWTPATVRRHKRWLYSVDAPALGGSGYALTLTVRETPPSAEVWRALRKSWVERLRRRDLVRLHWVTEWQARGTPHMHVAAYFAHELTPAERWELLGMWLDVAGEYGAGWRSQDVKPIDGPVGWLQYLSKHAARGVAHYQRQGKPAGWESAGRLWGYVGEWPTVEPLTVALTTEEAHRFRRLVRSWRVADARASGDWSRVTYARRMLRCPDPSLSRVRGVSEWIPEHIALRLLDVAADGAHGGPA
jgi:hypothetical protein